METNYRRLTTTTTATATSTNAPSPSQLHLKGIESQEHFTNNSEQQQQEVKQNL